MGLDPEVGTLHADLKHRDSFVFDVIEPLRLVVDGYLLAMLEERTFTVREFFETRQGVCRLMPPLPQALAEMAPRLATLAAPVVEQMAQRLTHGHGTTAKPLTTPTLLTQSNRSAGRNGVRTTPKLQKLEAPAACRSCGVILEDATRQYCDECRPEIQATQMREFSAAGREKLAELRAAGQDPSQGGEAAKKRAAALRRRKREVETWEAEHGEIEVDETVFTTELLPRLQGVPLSEIAAATRLSLQYCSLIRRGLKVPHQRHWSAFKNFK